MSRNFSAHWLTLILATKLLIAIMLLEIFLDRVAAHPVYTTHQCHALLSSLPPWLKNFLKSIFAINDVIAKISANQSIRKFLSIYQNFLTFQELSSIKCGLAVMKLPIFLEKTGSKMCCWSHYTQILTYKKHFHASHACHRGSWCCTHIEMAVKTPKKSPFIVMKNWENILVLMEWNSCGFHFQWNI